MNEALFSEVVLIERSKPEPAQSARSSSRKSPKSAAEQPYDPRVRHDAFTSAFFKTLMKLNISGPENGDIARLASIMADLATGDGVALRLTPGLPEISRKSVQTFLEAIVKVSGSLEESRLEDAINKLADVILPDALGEARGALAKDNLELRDRFIREVPQLTSADVGRHAGSAAKNLYATAARWKKSAEIFSVQHRGTEYFPAFQFRDGRPHPTVKAALGALPENFTAWQQAFWFVSSNGWLDDKAPANMLDQPEAVIAAATRERQEVVG